MRSMDGTKKLKSVCCWQDNFCRNLNHHKQAVWWAKHVQPKTTISLQLANQNLTYCLHTLVFHIPTYFSAAWEIQVEQSHTHTEPTTIYLACAYAPRQNYCHCIQFRIQYYINQMWWNSFISALLLMHHLRAAKFKGSVFSKKKTWREWHYSQIITEFMHTTCMHSSYTSSHNHVDRFTLAG